MREIENGQKVLKTLSDKKFDFKITSKICYFDTWFKALIDIKGTNIFIAEDE